MSAYNLNMANNANMLPVPQQQQQQPEAARPPPKRRNRKAVSCVSCREKKIKCDRVVPCNQCIKRGEQDQCRIEQRPQIIHDHAHSHNTVPAQPWPNYIDPLSSGSAAYSQFSAATSTAKDQVNAAHPSGNPAPTEAEAVKLRFAQVEALLVGQTPLSSANAFDPQSPAASSNWNVYRSTSGPGSGSAEFDLSRIKSNSPANSFPSSAHHSSTSPHGPPDDTDESDADDDTAPSSPRAESRRVSPSNRLRTDQMPVSRKEMDSDTEDAAVVLERLAMDDASQLRWGSAGNGCPLQKTGAQNPNAEQYKGMVIESLATGDKFERCLQKDKEVGLMSVPDHNATNASSYPSQTLIQSATSVVSLPASGQREPTGMLLPSLSSAQDPDTRLDGQPSCACRAPSDSAHGHDHTQDYECLKKNEPASKDPSPITVPCKLACENRGLLRLKSGPETLLGWGMGWAWSAAEILLQQDQQKAKLEGVPFVSTSRTEREAVLRAVCESLPSKQIAYQLIEVYESRARYLCGHVIHVPCLKREMEAFYALDSTEKRARVINHVDPGWLGMFVMVLALGIRFYPCTPKAGWQPANHLFDGKTIHAWHSAAKSCLVLANYLNSSSMSVIQAILLIYLFGSVSGASCGGEADSGTTNIALIRIAITNAQEMGLHRLGDLDKQPRPNEPSSKVIRREIAKRIWWALVFRDWSAAGTGCSKDYIIRSEHFNTPLPGNYNDDDLMLTPLPAPRPREEFTEMSYVLSNLEFGMVVKEDVDIRHRRELHTATNGGDRRITCSEAQKLDFLYRSVLENAPSFFKVGSEIGRVTCIEVQRWLLQQAIFSKLLRIHRPNLSSRKESRTNCVLLARSILDMQKKIRSRCTVIDRLWVNLMQSFSAAIVLALHLLHTRPTADHRVSVRSEITEAIRALKQVDGNDCASKKCIRIIEALLEEEEERWQAGNAALARKDDSSPQETAKPKRKRQMDVEGGDDEAAPVSGVGRRKNLLSLAHRVAQATSEDGFAQQRQASTAPIPTDDPSKRQATLAAVRPMSGAQNNALLEVNGVTALKDDASLFLMNNTTLPSFGPSPLPSASGNADDVPFPQMLQAMPLASNLFKPDGVDPSQRMVPPNGVDLMLNNPVTPPDGQPFDLAAFLEQVTNSPGSSTDISLSSGNERSASTSSDVSGLDDKASASAFGGSTASLGDATDNTSVSSFGEPLLTKEAIHRQQQHLQASAAGNAPAISAPVIQNGTSAVFTTQNSSPASAHPEVTTDMDSFWNWIITQGANGITAPTTASAYPTQAAPVLVQTSSSGSANGNDALAINTMASPPYQQQMPQNALYATQSTFPPTPQSAHSGLTPFLSPDGFFNNTAEPKTHGYPTPSSLASSSTSPARVGSNVMATSNSTPAYQPLVSSASGAVPVYAATPEAQKGVGAATGGVSVGTPSAGFGLDAFLGAPLYDFADFANAWTASNPASAPMGSSMGPVSDP